MSELVITEDRIERGKVSLRMDEVTSVVRATDPLANLKGGGLIGVAMSAASQGVQHVFSSLDGRRVAIDAKTWKAREAELGALVERIVASSVARAEATIAGGGEFRADHVAPHTKYVTIGARELKARVAKFIGTKEVTIPVAELDRVARHQLFRKGASKGEFAIRTDDYLDLVLFRLLETRGVAVQ